jgi:hypothetical protein
MIDVDLISHLDVRTGLPVVDHLSPTQRWRDALDHGSEQNLSSDTLEPRKHFGPVGADHNTKPKTAAPTVAHNNKLKQNKIMEVKHNPKLRAYYESEVKPATPEEVAELLKDLLLEEEAETTRPRRQHSRGSASTVTEKRVRPARNKTSSTAPAGQAPTRTKTL